MSDETAVKTRHKGLLQEIREENIDGGISDEFGRGSASFGEDSILGTQRLAQRIDRIDSTGSQGIARVNGAEQRSNQGIRQADNESEYAAPRNDRSDETIGEPELTDEQKAERERELARQRQQRKRDREKAERDANNGLLFSENEQDLSLNRDRDRNSRITQAVTPIKNIVTHQKEESRFHIENPLEKIVEDVSDKLFSQKEVDEKTEKLAKVLQQLSSLPDGLLEIIVKDHQKVRIWRLDQTEALYMASLQMNKAKTSKADAKWVRALLALEERIFILTLVGTRIKLTAAHVQEHEGFSFK